MTNHEDTKGTKSDLLARIERMEGALRRISIWAACDHMSRETREKAMADINKAASDGLTAENTL